MLKERFQITIDKNDDDYFIVIPQDPQQKKQYKICKNIFSNLVMQLISKKGNWIIP